MILRGEASQRGRFGASLAVLPDLNADEFNDLAIGAPLENDGQGSIYIFHGKGREINPTYSQVSDNRRSQTSVKVNTLSSFRSKSATKTSYK